jgi:hypothetical protein
VPTDNPTWPLQPRWFLSNAGIGTSVELTDRQKKVTFKKNFKKKDKSNHKNKTWPCKLDKQRRNFETKNDIDVYIEGFAQAQEGR